MGISHVMAHWFERLHHRGAFAGLRSILELGPQDLVMHPTVLANFVTGVTGVEQSPAAIEARFYEGGKPRSWTAGRDFYALLGLDDYHGADIGDQRANYSVDLNKPVRLGRQFDVITNFGTLEHVFDIANGMELIHDHVKPGGLMLHVMPTRGDYNHGFYNINSRFYRNVAIFNRYEVVDLVNVPDFGGQHKFIEANEKIGDRPPRRSVLVDVSRDDDPAREQEFAKLVLARHGDAKTVFDTVFDYVFAAFRKTSDAPFIQPQQTDAGDLNSVAPDTLRDPTESRVVAEIGPAVAYLQAERWNDAELRARAALEVVPEHPGALHVLGLVFARTGRPDEALQSLKRACEIAPDNMDALKHLGLVLRAVGRTADAISCFRHIVAVTPTAAHAHFDLAATLHQAGDLAGAASVYRRVVTLEPGHLGAREALAAMEPARSA